MAGSTETVFARAFRRLLSSRVVWVSAGVSLCLAGASFVRALFAAEGTSLTVPVVWAVSALPCMALLAALVSMRLWSDDRASGYLEALLVAPVFERSYVTGRFLAALVLAALVLAGHWIFSFVLLCHYAPTLASRLGWLSFAAAYVGLLFPMAAVTAIGSWFSVVTKYAAVAATVTLIVVLAVPLAVFEAATAWVPSFRAMMAETPFTTFARHAAEGVFSLSGTVSYVATAAAALFTCSKALAACRFVGKGGRMLRWSGRVAVLLAWVLAVLLCGVSWRFDTTLALPSPGTVPCPADAVRGILSDLPGALSITCLVPRSSPSYQPSVRLVTALAADARRKPGVLMTVRFVDSRWDVAEATRLVASGCPDNSILFESGHRRVIVGADGADVSSCVVALARLARPLKRETVCWTVGHGEASFEDYDPAFGMSEAARAFLRTGFRFEKLDLSQAVAIPEDCAFLAVASPRTAFSSRERMQVEGYLKNGGRLLVICGQEGATGLDPLLASRGLALVPPKASARDDAEADRTVRTFADHPITRSLAGSSLVFSSAAASCGVAAANGTNRADAVTFTALAEDAGRAYAVALEVGGELPQDLELRPTRIVVVGDPAFALNASVARRANANVTFLLKSAAWLSGFETTVVPDAGTVLLATGMERRDRMHFTVRMCLLPPGVMMAFAVFAYLRRRMLS